MAINSSYFKKGHLINLGRKHTKETREKMSLSGIGRKNSAESKEKNRIAHLGRVPMSGQSHWNWKGGITPFRIKIYFSKEYKLWRKSVFERDDYRCFDCGERGGELNADHIYPFALFPRLRLELENGRTLCVDCHRRTKTWGGNSRKIFTRLW